MKSSAGDSPDSEYRRREHFNRRPDFGPRTLGRQVKRRYEIEVIGQTIEATVTALAHVYRVDAAASSGDRCQSFRSRGPTVSRVLDHLRIAITHARDAGAIRHQRERDGLRLVVVGG